MPVRFAQSYRFNEQQLARMVAAGVIPREHTEVVDSVLCRAGVPIRFSEEDYCRIHELAILDEAARVELIDGEVVEMASITGPHCTCVFDVDDFLRSVVSGAVRVTMHMALHLQGSYPVPDLTLLRRADHVRGELPTAAVCMLVVEVADSTAKFDRNDKRELYARAGLPEYWVVDLNTSSVVQHLLPISGDYQAVSEHARETTFISPALSGKEVRVAELIK